MNFHHLAYWQDKALSLAIENRLFINGEYTAAAENETFETVDPVTQAPLAKIARGKSVDMTVPFGGYKQSGNGRDKSLHALEKFTELKTIWISLEA